MISKDEVKHIAKLARLELTEKEIIKMQKDLSSILDYFNLLKKIPKPRETERVIQPHGDMRPLRKDEVISSHDLIDELIAAFPEKKDDYIKVKSIF